MPPDPVTWIVLAVGAGLATALAVGVARRAVASGTMRWAVAVTVGLLALTCWSFGAGEVGRATGNVWNAARLAPSFALARDIPLYAARDQGPVLGDIYGPLVAIAYYPCTWLDEPRTAMMAGALLSAVMMMFPGLVAVWLTAGQTGSGWFEIAVSGLALACLVIVSAPLRYATFSIHADAPAIGLGTLTCALAAAVRDSRRRRSWIAPALLATLSVWSKQTMLPLLPALPVWVLAVHGGRAAGRCALSVVGVFVLVSTAILCLHDPATLWFNMVAVPGRHPWQQMLFARIAVPGWLPGWITTAKVLCEAFMLAIVYAASPILLAVLIVSPTWRRHAEPYPGAPSTAVPRWTVFLTAGVFLMPASVVGRVKLGGDVNAFACSAYPLTVASILLCLERRDAFRIWHRRLRGRRWMAAAASWLGTGLGAILLVAALRHWARGAIAACPTADAWAWARAHPGEVYPAWNPLVGLMADGRAYHFDWGMLDRRLAGYPLSIEHFRAHVPTRMRYVVVELPMLEAWRYLPPLERTRKAHPSSIVVYEMVQASERPAGRRADSIGGR